MTPPNTHYRRKRGKSVKNVIEKWKDNHPNLKPLKQKLTKAERHELQKSQRASKGE